MVRLIAILLVFIGLAKGVPLEPPTTIFAKFFSPRIVGGSDAPPGSAPYMAAIVFGSPRMLMCGGFIVSTKCVLTAAHCIDPFISWTGELTPSLRLIVGSNVWKKDHGVAYEVEDYRNHPEWDPWNIKNDIGAFFVKTEIVLNKLTQILTVSFDVVPGGEKAFVNGWGLTHPWNHETPKMLQRLEVWTIEHQECVEAVEKAAGIWGAPPVSETAEICTFHSVGHGMCNGDSGSALISASSGKAIGIVSWGFPCAIGAPDMFTRTSGMKSFVESILGHY